MGVAEDARDAGQFRVFFAYLRMCITLTVLVLYRGGHWQSIIKWDYFKSPSHSDSEILRVVFETLFRLILCGMQDGC